MADPYVHNDGSECLWDIHDQKWVRMHPLYPLRECERDHEPLCEGLAPFCCGNPSCPAHGTDADNVHHIERPEDYLSPDLLRFLADEKAEEAAPHCATCRCGEG